MYPQVNFDRNSQDFDGLTLNGNAHFEDYSRMTATLLAATRMAQVGNRCTARDAR
jgi:hypothetical protein